MAKAYQEMVSTNPYALLAKSTYEKNAVPLSESKEYDPELPMNENNFIGDDVEAIQETQHGSGSEVEEEEESDEEFREHFIRFPKHSEFLIKFRNAKLAADKNQKRSYVCWRGYKTSLAPRDTMMTFPRFKKHLTTALKTAKEVSDKESQVRIKKPLIKNMYVYIYFSFLD